MDSPDGAVRQIVTNLLQNALDAVDGCPARRIEVKVAHTNEVATLVVRDSGPGVDKTLIDRVFQPFVTSKPPGKGTGLGLFVARQLLKQVGGRITIHNETGAGACVKVRWLTATE